MTKDMATNSPADKKVSVVIPTFNGQQLLETHLPAVLAELKANDQVVIVDDASTDSTISWLLEKYQLAESEKSNVSRHPQFTTYQGSYNSIEIVLIQNHKNLRFGQAVNRAVSLASHPYILLLNNDVRPLPSLRDQLLSHFSDPSVFAVGCLEFEMKEGEDYRQAAIGGKNKLWFAKGMFFHSRADDFSTGPTAWASGGSALFDKAKWLQLGGFDKAYYPAYWEDVDLSYRAQKQGWQVLFDQDAKVEHYHETTNTTVFGQRKIAKMSWRGAVTFVWKNGTLWQKCLHIFWKPYWWWQQAKQL